MKMMYMKIYIILPGLFGVCPQTRQFFILLIEGVKLMECGYLWKKVRGHLLEGSMVMGLIKEGEGVGSKIGHFWFLV